MSVEPDYEAVAQQRYHALCASFAQTWHEMFDSPLAAEIFNAGFEEWETAQRVAVWEGEGGPVSSSARTLDAGG